MYFLARLVCSSWGTAVGPRAISTFPRTVFHGMRANVWKITPILGLGRVIAWSWKRTRPLVAVSSPSMILSRVLLPQPLGPTIQRNSFPTLKVIRSRTVAVFPVSPRKVLVTLSTRIIGSDAWTANAQASNLYLSAFLRSRRQTTRLIMTIVAVIVRIVAAIITVPIVGSKLSALLRRLPSPGT